MLCIDFEEIKTYIRIYFYVVNSSLQMVQLSNWLPSEFSQAAGMEVARLSFLGPFFALSVIAEDNVRLTL